MTCPRGHSSVLLRWSDDVRPHGGYVPFCYECGRGADVPKLLPPAERPADSGSAFYKQRHPEDSPAWNSGLPKQDWPTQSGRHPAVELPQGHSERRQDWPTQGMGPKAVQRQHQHGMTPKGRE